MGIRMNARQRPAVRLFGGLVAGLLLGGTGPVARANVVLHEYLEADPAEDLKLGATSLDGTMAAAIQTQSGPVASPEAGRAADPGRRTYGGEQGGGPGGSYHIDGDTSRPDRVSYDDPFTPADAPYKREFAFDTVDAKFDLAVRDPALGRLGRGGVARPEDDQFYADLDVEMTSAQAARIPTVGPGARVLAARSEPTGRLEFLHDGADNWFARGDLEGRVRLVLHVAVDRAVFGSPFADVEWPRLYRVAPALPDAVKREGLRVARQVGVVDGTGPAEALRILVQHFRSFGPSDDHPSAVGADLYRELALSKKGVCRHRSYAFVVTALALGIPSRFVRNEAHAWVEVFDGTRWHRIDLGGAAGELDFSASRVAHVPPRDPFEWPGGADSGQAMADRARAGQGLLSPGGGTHASTVSSAGVAPDSPENTEPSVDDRRPHSTVAISLGGKEALRGARVRVTGSIEAQGAACPQVRVDLFLEPGSGAVRDRIPVGTLVTNDEGRYDGHVVIPFTVPPGDYDVRASTPGSPACGEGQSP